jgi:hypothetical protein
VQNFPNIFNRFYTFFTLFYTFFQIFRNFSHFFNVFKHELARFIRRSLGEGGLVLSQITLLIYFNDAQKKRLTTFPVISRPLLPYPHYSNTLTGCNVILPKPLF